MASSAIATPNGVSTTQQDQNIDKNLSSHADPTTNGDSERDNAADTITAAPPQPASSSSSSVSPPPPSTPSVSAKRKRDTPDDASPASDATPKPSEDAGAARGPSATDKSTIRDYFYVLQTFDATPSVLKRPLVAKDAASTPTAKRQKAADGSAQPSISEKFANDEYQSLTAIITDVKSSIDNQLAELRDTTDVQDTKANDVAMAKTITFGQKAQEILRREMSYRDASVSEDFLRTLDSTSALQSNASGNIVLSVHGLAPRPTQLYSSLQQPVASEEHPQGRIRSMRDAGLPAGIKTTKAVPFFFPAAVEKDKKSKTLGDLFPTPRNLPVLQPPKAPKSAIKGAQVGWHRPELTDKDKYRTGTYFSQKISTGNWLDYSNAAPASQIKQRERPASQSGEQSSVDVEAAEMEALFRGAFSSFAPTKDDSASMISSGLLGQTLWWQKVGRRNLDRLVVETGALEETGGDVEMADAAGPDGLDEGVILDAIDNWDDKLVDPSLEEACCPKKKTDEERDVDEILEDVSDMIQTLLSYQKNRNLQQPSAGQNRYAADSSQNDALAGGALQPGEEEMATYGALKAQLSLVLNMLPPYAVARLNSDKLDELSISTRLEIRTDEYQGLMESDDAAARARAAQATPNARPAPHRSSNSASGMHYGQQYANNGRPPAPAGPYYGQQTPVRPPPSVQRPPPSMPPAYQQQRPPSNAGYRPPSGYPQGSYAQQPPKPAPGYSQPNPYGTPAQNRAPYQQYPGYPHTAPHNPQVRYPSYAPNAQTPTFHHQPYQPPHPQQGTPTHVQYGQYANGAMPQRTASPHMPPHHQPQHMPHQPHQGYNPNVTPSRQPAYGGQPNMASNSPRPYYPSGSPMPPHQGQNPPPYNPQKAGHRPSMSGQGHNPMGTPVGHGARPGMQHGGHYYMSSQSPKPQQQSPAMRGAPSPAMNGSPVPPPHIPGHNGGPMPGREA